MLPILTDKQRQAIEEHGTPMAMVDGLTSGTYILLSVEVFSDPDQSGFTARIPGIEAFGGGDTEQEASLALCEALRGYLDAFGER